MNFQLFMGLKFQKKKLPGKHSPWTPYLTNDLHVSVIWVSSGKEPLWDLFQGVLCRGQSVPVAVSCSLCRTKGRFRRHNFGLRLSHAACSSHDLRAIVAGFWNMFQNPTAFFELYATVLGKLWGWFTRSNPCRMDDVSKLHATVVSQSCAV